MNLNADEVKRLTGMLFQVQEAAKDLAAKNVALESQHAIDQQRIEKLQDRVYVAEGIQETAEKNQAYAEFHQARFEGYWKEAQAERDAALAQASKLADELMELKSKDVNRQTAIEVANAKAEQAYAECRRLDASLEIIGDAQAHIAERMRSAAGRVIGIGHRNDEMECQMGGRNNSPCSCGIEALEQALSLTPSEAEKKVLAMMAVCEKAKRFLPLGWDGGQDAGLQLSAALSALAAFEGKP